MIPLACDSASVRKNLVPKFQKTVLKFHGVGPSKSFLCFADTLVNLQLPLELGLKARAIPNITSWVSGTESRAS